MLEDVRSEAAFDADERLTIGASEEVDRLWRPLPRRSELPPASGQPISKEVFGLARNEIAAAPKAPRQADSEWITREHPKIDRIACPWLVSRL